MSRIILPSRKLWTPPQRQTGYVVVDPYRFGGSRLWVPSDLAGVNLKVQCDDQSSVTDVSGFADRWSNLATPSWPGDALNSSRRPAIIASGLNGLRVLRFTSDCLQFGGAASIFQNVSAGWIFAVVKKSGSDASPTSRRIFYGSINGSSAPRCALYGDDAGTGAANKIVLGARRTDAGSYYNVKTTTNTNDVWVAVLGIADYVGREMKIYTNGALEDSTTGAFDASGNTSNTASTQISMGATYTPNTFWDGDIACILAGSNVPSSGEIAKLFGCYMWRYGLQANLPGGHAYASGAPMV